MSPDWRSFYLCLIVILLQGNICQVTAQSRFKTCCDIGTSWAKEDLRCEKYTGPVPGVPKAEQTLCLEAIDICCVRAYHEKGCEKGKQNARKGLACAESSNINLGSSRSQNNQRDCCEGCKLGILTGAMGQGCTLSDFSFGNPWDPAFLECCNEALTSTTIFSTIAESKKTSTSSDDDTSFNKTTKSLTTLTSTHSSDSLTTSSTLIFEFSTPILMSSTLSSKLDNISTTLSTSDSSTYKFSSFDGQTTVPTPPIDDICVLLKGLLCSHICIPTPGSYYCKCPEGYVLLEDEKTCRTDGPINRCESDNPCEHRCIDTGTDVKCECDPGFHLAKDNHSCELKLSQVNTTTYKTTTKSRDSNKTKSKCPPGYQYNLTARVCDDVDECQENPCSLENKCENVVGSYICIANKKEFLHSIIENQRDVKESCPPGYQWDQLLESCIDIDECIELAESPCPNDTHLCVNTQGSFACHKLTASKSCPAGFKFNITTKTCQDVDECAEGLHGCLAQVEECRNTEGAYECDVQCRKGFFFSRSLGICLDVNECREIDNPCPGIRSICVNTPGAYQCRMPSEASEISKDHFNVNDNDNELIDNELAATKNVENNYVVSQAYLNKSLFSSPISSAKFSALRDSVCELGYHRDGNTCVDIDECTEGPGCQDHERCINRLGGYDCLPLCNTGWFFEPFTKQCQDVDECLLGRHNCTEITQICRNTNGSYVCETVTSCSPGFRRIFNGSCVDIDECNEKLHTCSSSLHQYCVNRIGTYDCVTRLPECMDGYRYSLASQQCEDINECITRSPCDARLSEKCINLPGSYKCERPATIIHTRRRPACPTGYQYDSRTRQCEDINECEEQEHLCSEREVCYNQPGGYSCAKLPEPLTEVTTIEDKELSTPNLKNLQKCAEGMKFVRNRGCTDINECEEIEDACTSNEECVNTIGSFTCNCRVGFRRENLTLACVDINECQLQNDCLPSQRCDNTLGSYNCVRFLPCGTGYTLNAATEICEDDDECLLGTHDCGEGYHCRNTLGSYRCDKNLRNQTTRTFSKTTRPLIQSTTVMTKIISRTTTPIIVTERPTIPIAESTTVTPSIDSRFQSQTEPKPCPSGFERGSSGQCNDIDECQRGPANPCAHSPLQRCLNTIGSYRCVSRVICGPGWVLDPATSHCIDVDECAEKSHECGPEQICENRQGGYVCSCPPGHVIGPNKDCIDIDECSVFGSKICGNNGQCVNTPGSYQCTCNEGFQKSRKGTSCQDINECEKTPGICQHDCINIWGSYRCSCRHGFRLHSDKRSCTDINECEEFKENNLCVGICDNTPGSYSCSCPEGYRLGIDGRTCQDIDECATGRVCQNPSEMCQNTRGSFRCNKINCPSGYHLDPQRRNRCVRSSRYCSSDDLACFRSPSHYSYNFITFVSMFPLPPTGQLELFTMRGTHLPGSIMRFSMALVDARAPPGITRATESCFALRRPSPTQAILVLTRMLPGPQEIELDLSMEIYHKTTFAGSAVAKIFIYVTQYEF
ncbi:fibrillin-1-like [Chelonus insularis]|uniref:fibrillin-1-like n=1 Tax=Chelonus insularis TaxID=460826 RepID=UPI00158CA349|nr:fibrillin-1-like [Chelonus insularis]